MGGDVRRRDVVGMRNVNSVEMKSRNIEYAHEQVLLNG